ncbi:DUF4168 domain-containing protein [Oculatella sp. LEGE 06141]|uniref:DUF4168 domain-containing protein n=1 Tax=Oculatella sp. LEGE 06141 TaxID=1828648 RepID=UPI0018801E47|nr:DUF4168 domain-containing protein [Oculatella sp. LEGE 06141]MBE9178877.1 DUF4168 domain-containing protein [Oculatella sp. LEGE 06141]
MSAHNYFALLKKLPGIVGVVSASALLSLPVLAQSAPGSTSSESTTEVAQTADEESSATTEFELSPQGLEILCERFPLNSRCEDGATAPGAAAPESGWSEDALNPSSDEPVEETTDPEADPGVPTQIQDDTTEPSDDDGFSDPGAMTPGTMTPGTMAPGTRPSEDALSPSSGEPVEETTDPEADPGVPTQIQDDTTEPSGDDGFSDPGAMAPESSPSADLGAAELGQAPPSAPAPTAPAAPGTSAPATDVSQAELQQFANAIPELQALEQSAQQEVAQTIQSSGLSRERFTEIFQSQQSPTATPSSEVSEDEQQSFEEAIAQIQSIERETLSQQAQVLQSQGLEPERFNQILAAIRQDPALQQQVQQLLPN